MSALTRGGERAFGPSSPVAGPPRLRNRRWALTGTVHRRSSTSAFDAPHTEGYAGGGPRRCRPDTEHKARRALPDGRRASPTAAIDAARRPHKARPTGERPLAPAKARGRHRASTRHQRPRSTRYPAHHVGLARLRLGGPVSPATSASPGHGRAVDRPRSCWISEQALLKNPTVAGRARGAAHRTLHGVGRPPIDAARHGCHARRHGGLQTAAAHVQWQRWRRCRRLAEPPSVLVVCRQRERRRAGRLRRQRRRSFHVAASGGPDRSMRVVMPPSNART